MAKLTQQQIENIQIDYGIVYLNFGEATQVKLGPTKGGATFDVTKTMRDIEFDGARGKEKGLKVIDDIMAKLSLTNLDISIETLSKLMPYATLEGDGGATPYSLKCKTENIGMLPDSAYLENVTMFAKLTSGGYKKIILYNAMAENDFSLAAVPKGEGGVAVEIFANWDPQDETVNLYEIHDVSSLTVDGVAPTIVTTPPNGDTDVVVSSSLTGVFSEDIKQVDINDNNFVLSAAGVVITGTLSYVSATKTVTFSPDVDLDAATDHVWVITNVRDLAGNKMEPVIVIFTTA